AWNFIRKLKPVAVFANQQSQLPFMLDVLPGHLNKINILHKNFESRTAWKMLSKYGERADITISVSREIRELAAKAGLEEKQIEVIPCGIFYPENVRKGKWNDLSEVRFCYAGRLTKDGKNVLDFLDVFAILDNYHEQHPIGFTMIGSGPLQEQLEKEVIARNYRIKVRFLGRLSPDQLQAELSKAHFYLTVSGAEGMPISVREAMAHAVIPIATDIKAHTEIIRDNVNGFIFPLKDYAKLKSVIERVLNTPTENLESCAMQAREDMISHSRDKIAAQYARLLTVEN
nr:glycosyltransferase family 4 protein [Bacteroidota bacterium]